MASSRICSIPDCGKSSYLRGWCCAHYNRWKRYGDPTSRPAKKVKICGVEGCNEHVKSYGFCSVHSGRFERTGDPLYLKIREPGKRLAFLKSMVGHTGDDCVFWPFGASKDGYGRLGYNGKTVVATRLMAILAHGLPSNPGMHAAHSCNNGHLGCVNPNHLQWKTSKENGADRRHSKRQPRGETHLKAVLTEEDVVAIRKAVASGELTLAAAGKMYGVHVGTVQGLVSGRTWRHIPLAKGQ